MLVATLSVFAEVRADDCDNCRSDDCACIGLGWVGFCSDYECYHCNNGYHFCGEGCCRCTGGSSYDVGRGYYRTGTTCSDSTGSHISDTQSRRSCTGGSDYNVGQGYYQTGSVCSGTGTSNTQTRRACRSHCSQGQYLGPACTGTGRVDRTCHDCVSHRPGYYRSRECSGYGTSDTTTWIQCRSSCPTGYHMSAPCSGWGTEDRTCTPCSHGGEAWNVSAGYYRSGTLCSGTGTTDTQSRTACRTNCDAGYQLTPGCFGGDDYTDTTQCVTGAPTAVPTTSNPSATPSTSTPTASPTESPTKLPTTSDPTTSPSPGPTAGPTRAVHFGDTLRTNLLRMGVSNENIADLEGRQFFGALSGHQVLTMRNTHHPTDTAGAPIYMALCASQTGNGAGVPDNTSLTMVSLLPSFTSDVHDNNAGATCGSTLGDWAASFARPFGALYFTHCYDVRPTNEIPSGRLKHFSYIEGDALSEVLNGPLGDPRLGVPRLTVADEGCGDDYVVKFEFVSRSTGIDTLLEATTGRSDNGVSRAIGMGAALIPGLSTILQTVDNPRVLVHPARQIARAGGTKNGVHVDFTLASVGIDDTCASRGTDHHSCRCVADDCDPAVALTIAAPSDVDGIDGLNLYAVISNTVSRGSLSPSFAAPLSMFTGATFGVILADGFDGFNSAPAATGLFGLRPPLSRYILDEAGGLTDGIHLIALISNNMLPDDGTGSADDAACNVLCQMAKDLLDDGQYLMMTGRVTSNSFRLEGYFQDNNGENQTYPTEILPGTGIRLTRVGLRVGISWGDEREFEAMIRGRFEVPRAAYRGNRDVDVTGENWVFRFSDGTSRTEPASDFAGLADGPLKFGGGIGVELSTTGPAFRFRFELRGYAMNTFGASHFHMGNTGIDLRLGGAVFPFVQALAARTDLCLGSYGRCALCLSGRDCTKAIRAQVFASVGTVISNNWFHGSFSGDLSLNGFLEALEYHDVLRYLPDALSIVALRPRTGQQSLVVSFAPRRIYQPGLLQADGTTTTFMIPKGFQFDGGVTLFPNIPALSWNADLRVVMSTQRFYINYVQDPIQWGCNELRTSCILTFTSIDSPDRGPRFYVDARFPSALRSGLTDVSDLAEFADGVLPGLVGNPSRFSLEALIDARIVVLGISAAVRVNITSEHAHFAIEGALFGSFLRVGAAITVNYRNARSLSFRARGYIQQGGVSQIAQRAYNSMQNEGSEAAEAQAAAEAEVSRIEVDAASRQRDAADERDRYQQEYTTAVNNYDRNERDLRNARNSEAAKSAEMRTLRSRAEKICSLKDCRWYNAGCHARNAACSVVRAAAWAAGGVRWLIGRVNDAIVAIARRIESFVENSRVFRQIRDGKFNLLTLAEAAYHDAVDVSRAALNAVVESVARVRQVFASGLEFLGRMAGKALAQVITIHNLEVDMELSANVQAVTFRVSMTVFGFQIDEQMTIDFGNIAQAIWNIIRTVVDFVKDRLGFRRRRQLEAAMADAGSWDPLVERAARQIMTEPAARQAGCNDCLLAAAGFLRDVHRTLAEIQSSDEQLLATAANMTSAMDSSSVESILLASMTTLMAKANSLDAEPGSDTQWTALVGNISLDDLLMSRELQTLNSTFQQCSEVLRARAADISTAGWYMRLQAALGNRTLNGIGCTTGQLQCSGVSSCIHAASTYIEQTFAELTDSNVTDVSNSTDSNCDGGATAGARERVSRLFEQWRTNSVGPRLRNMMPCSTQRASVSDLCTDSPSTLAEALDITDDVNTILGSIQVRDVCGNISMAAYVNTSGSGCAVLNVQQSNLTQPNVSAIIAGRPVFNTTSHTPDLFLKEISNFAPVTNIPATMNASFATQNDDGPWSFFAPTDARIGQLLRANITFDQQGGAMSIRVPRCLESGSFLVRLVAGTNLDEAIDNAPRRYFSLDFGARPASQQIVEIAEDDAETGWLRLASNFDHPSGGAPSGSIRVRAHRANEQAAMVQLNLTIILVNADADECTSDIVSFSADVAADEGDTGALTWIGVGVGAVLLILIITVIVLRRKKSNRAVFEPTPQSQFERFAMGDSARQIHANPMFTVGISNAVEPHSPGPNESSIPTCTVVAKGSSCSSSLASVGGSAVGASVYDTAGDSTQQYRYVLPSAARCRRACPPPHTHTHALSLVPLTIIA